MNDIHIIAIKVVVVLVGGILLGGLALLTAFEVENAAQIRSLEETVLRDQKDIQDLLRTQRRLLRGLGWGER
jgi:ribosomal protein L10